MAKTTQPRTTTKYKLSKNQKIAVGVVVTLVVLVAINLLTGIFSYAFYYAKCGGQPITASRFAADYHYSKPGQVSYGPNAFKEYYCIEQEAKDAGFGPAAW